MSLKSRSESNWLRTMRSSSLASISFISEMQAISVCSRSSNLVASNSTPSSSSCNFKNHQNYVCFLIQTLFQLLVKKVCILESKWFTWRVLIWWLWSLMTFSQFCDCRVSLESSVSAVSSCSFNAFSDSSRNANCLSNFNLESISASSFDFDSTFCCFAKCRSWMTSSRFALAFECSPSKDDFNLLRSESSFDRSLSWISRFLNCSCVSCRMALDW